MENRKKVRVLMLSSHDGHGSLLISPANGEEIIYKYLYFISASEKLKKGDLIEACGRIGRYDYDAQNNTHDLNTIGDGKTYPYSTSEYLCKIIATTDPSLKLPLIPQSFIEQYVVAKGKIEEVEIGMIQAHSNEACAKDVDEDLYQPAVHKHTGCIMFPDGDKEWDFSEVFVRENIQDYPNDNPIILGSINTARGKIETEQHIYFLKGNICVCNYEGYIERKLNLINLITLHTK